MWMKDSINNLIELDKISLDYRHDILLREYVIRNNDKKTWNQFLANQIKYSLPNSNSYEGLMSLVNDIHKNGIKEPLTLFHYDGKLIVSDGAHRLSIAKALNMVKIPVVLDSRRQTIIPIYLVSKKYLEDSNILFKSYYQDSDKIGSVFEGIDEEIYKEW